MEVILAIAIGILGGSGVWLVLRPRTFQVLMGLSLLSYAVNLFIFAMGSLSHDKEPIVQPGVLPNLENYTDPLPQALVLTAIVIAFAMTAVSIVVAIRSRADNDSDHVDGSRAEREFLLAEQRRHEEAREEARTAAQAAEAGAKAGGA